MRRKKCCSYTRNIVATIAVLDARIREKKAKREDCHKLRLERETAIKILKHMKGNRHNAD